MPGCIPLQQAFLRHDAFQCGYCTPGPALLGRRHAHRARARARSPRTSTADPPLTPGEIRERMSGNLCRCGAYVNIVKAIMAGPAPDGGPS